MSYVARGAKGGPYVYCDGTDLRLYNLPGDRDTTIPMALFDELVVLRFFELLEEAEVENVLGRLAAERPEWNMTSIRTRLLRPFDAPDS